MKGPGIGGIGIDVAAELTGQIRDGSEYAAGDDLALDLGEPEFNLVEPGRVGGREMELNTGIAPGTRAPRRFCEPTDCPE